MSNFSASTRKGLGSDRGQRLVAPAVHVGRCCRTKYLHFLRGKPAKSYIREKQFNVFLKQ